MKTLLTVIQRATTPAMARRCTRYQQMIPMTRCRSVLACQPPPLNFPADRLDAVVRWPQNSHPHRLLPLLVPQQLRPPRPLRLHRHLFSGVWGHTNCGEQPGQLCEPRVRIWVSASRTRIPQVRSPARHVGLAFCGKLPSPNSASPATGSFKDKG